MSSVRYSDTELWQLEESLLNYLKDTLSMNQFSKWSISRLQELIKTSVDTTDWMAPEEVHLRTYRVKAQKFYEEKLIKEIR